MYPNGKQIQFDTIVQIRTSQEARSIFLQVACALAVAESVLEFEHRDLHWGNVLIARKRYHRVRYRLLQHEFDLETVGINVTVIDYTLSRLRKGECFSNAEEKGLSTPEFCKYSDAMV